MNGHTSMHNDAKIWKFCQNICKHAGCIFKYDRSVSLFHGLIADLCKATKKLNISHLNKFSKATQQSLKK